VSANVECTIKQWSKTFCATQIGYRQAQIDAGADPGGAIAPLKSTKRSYFTMILYNSENSIRDIRPFCRPLFCHSSVVKYTSSLLQ